VTERCHRTLRERLTILTGGAQPSGGMNAEQRRGETHAVPLHAVPGGQPALHVAKQFPHISPT
jgi:hypothetical protein